MLIDLETDEINTLIEAVKSWEKEPASEGTMRSMFSSIFETLDPNFNKMSREERKEHLERTSRREKDGVEALIALRRDTSILLQAKLIAARNKTS